MIWEHLLMSAMAKTWLRGPNRFREKGELITLCLKNEDGSYFLALVAESGGLIGLPVRVWLN